MITVYALFVFISIKHTITKKIYKKYPTAATIMFQHFEHYRSIRRFDSPTQVLQTWGNGDYGSVRIERKIKLIRIHSRFSQDESHHGVRCDLSQHSYDFWNLLLRSFLLGGCGVAGDAQIVFPEPVLVLSILERVLSAYCVTRGGKIMEKFRPMSTRRALMLFKDAPLRTRRASMLFKDDPLRTRRVLSLHKAYNDSALLVLNGTSLNSIDALLALSQQFSCLFVVVFLRGGGGDSWS